MKKVVLKAEIVPIPTMWHMVTCGSQVYSHVMRCFALSSIPGGVGQ